jgi:hypothetical protein
MTHAYKCNLKKKARRFPQTASRVCICVVESTCGYVSGKVNLMSRHLVQIETEVSRLATVGMGLSSETSAEYLIYQFTRPLSNPLFRIPFLNNLATVVWPACGFSLMHHRK